MCIDIQSSKLVLQDSLYQQSINNLAELNIGVWYKVTCSIQKKFNSLIKAVYLNDVIISTTQTPYSFVGQFILLITNRYTSCKLQVKNVQMFVGGFFDTCGTCFMSLDINNQNCLQCEDNQFLQKGQLYQCVPQCDTQFSNLAFKSCDFNYNQLIKCDTSTSSYYFKNNCVCQDGYYLAKQNNTQKCLPCPEFCEKCNSDLSCNGYKNKQRFKKQCDINEFDDGITCVQNNIFISKSQNKQIQINLSDHSSFFIKDQALRLGLESESFFASINFNLQLQQPQKINNHYMIFYLTDKGVILLTLAAQVVNLGQVQLALYQQQEIILKAHIELNVDTWVGVYTNLNEIGLIVKYQNSPTSYYTSRFKKIYPILTDPTLSKRELINILDFNFCEYSSVFIQQTVFIENQLDKKQVLKLQTPIKKFNQLDVIQVDSIIYSSGLEVIYFTVVLNYNVEYVELEFQLSNYNDPQLLYLVLGSQIQYCNTFYFSDIQIYLGRFYFINYDNSDPCFIYYNRSNFKCILPKKENALKNGQAIPKDNCNIGERIDSSILFFNPNSLKCQNSQIIIPYCLQINYDNLNVCKKCYDPQMIPSNFCSCPEGIFLNEKLQKCLVCSKNAKHATKMQIIVFNAWKNNQYHQIAIAFQIISLEINKINAKIVQYNAPSVQTNQNFAFLVVKAELILQIATAIPDIIQIQKMILQKNLASHQNAIKNAKRANTSQINVFYVKGTEQIHLFANVQQELTKINNMNRSFVQSVIITFIMIKLFKQIINAMITANLVMDNSQITVQAANKIQYQIKVVNVFVVQIIAKQLQINLNKQCATGK
ncbi:hypothetical protein ABPG72_021135 [Tetrahymena utriculariae]